MRKGEDWDGQKENDGVTQTAFSLEQGHIVRKQTQASETEIMERNKRLRGLTSQHKRNEHWQQEASIPLVMWNKWVKENPDLSSPDAAARDKCLQKLLYGTSYGKACLTRDNTAKSATRYFNGYDSDNKQKNTA